MSRGLVCLLAAAIAVLPEWAAIWYRYAPTGGTVLLGFTWRALLLGLVPVAAYLILESVVALVLPAVVPVPTVHRLRRLLSSRLGWSATSALVWGALAAAAWILVLSAWKDFDFPFHVPWVPWERRFRGLALETPLVATAGALCGAVFAWARHRGREPTELPPLLRNGAKVALVVGLIFALEGARRPLGLFGSFAFITRVLGFTALVVGLSYGFRRVVHDLPKSAALLGWTAVLGGGLGGIGLLVTGLAEPGPDVLALVDANRSVASKVFVRVVASPVQPIALACEAALSEPTVARDGSGALRDVVLVTVDALKGTHVSSNGYPLQTTPTIDSLAGVGLTFTDAFTTSSSTLLALPALLFARPFECIERGPESFPTLFDALSAAGFQTGLVSGYRLNDGVTSGYATAILRSLDITDFDAAGTVVHDTHPVDSAVAEQTEALVSRFDPERPMALWVHLYDPHSVYNPSREEALRFGSGRKARYDAEVHATDRAIGNILRTLRTHRADWDPLVVVTADHGESVDEVGARAHGYTMTHAVLGVPLVVAGWDERPGQRVDTPVSVLDLAPTVLDMLGIDAPPSYMGQSLLPLARGEVSSWRPVRFARPGDDGIGSADQRVFHQGYKLVHKVRPRQAVLYGTNDVFELYHPDSDPEERRNLIADRTRIAESLKQHLPYRAWNGDPAPTDSQGRP